jgi:hypothetical protein
MKKYFYGREVSIDQFNEAFCECFIYFDELWTSEDPEDIMQFSRIFSNFRCDFEQSMLAGSSIQLVKKSSKIE